MQVIDTQFQVSMVSTTIGIAVFYIHGQSIESLTLILYTELKKKLLIHFSEYFLCCKSFRVESNVNKNIHFRRGHFL